LVQDVVVSSTCREGIFVEGSNNDVEHSKVRSSLTGTLLTSIFVTGVGGHTIRRNQVAGSGPVPLGSSKAGKGSSSAGSARPPATPE
jgi:hypothetical protein